MKSNVKRIIIAVIIIAVIAAVCLFAFSKAGKKETVKEQATTFVTKGDVKVQITGTGTVEANEQYEITSLVTGNVVSANFEEGDILKKGAVMYTIDASSVNRSIQKQKNSNEKTQMEHNEILDNIEKLTVKSDGDGVITGVKVKKGDNVQNGAQIAEITDTVNMILKINFNSNDAQNLYIGQSAEVYLDSNMGQMMQGTVSRVSNGTVTSSNGVSVNTVEIRVKNPGGIKAGDTATAIIGEYACNDKGTFETGEVSYITAGVAGEVTQLNIHEGDIVYKGQIVAKLKSETLEKQLKQSNITLSDSEIGLQDLYDNLDKYTIEAPISGTVISKTTKAGDKLDNSNQKNVMAIVADMSVIKFKMNVDELDIAKLEVGQAVEVTADALEGKVFTGEVDYISIVGATSEGVTTYPVTIVINEPEGLVPGMNVDATITVQEAKNVLTVPVSAVNRGNIVYVKDDGKTDSKAKGDFPQMPDGKMPDGNMPEGKKSDMKIPDAKAMKSIVPEGFKAVRVEVGLSNNDVVEIISGLSEGDEIAYTETQSANTNNMMFGPMGGGMPGGMSGGMSGGMNGRMSGGMSGGMGGRP